MTQERAGFMNNVSSRIIAGVATAAVLSAAVYIWSGTARTPSGAVEPLTLAVDNRYVGSSLALIAQAKGYFTDAGLKVTLKPAPTGKAALESTLKGEADLATVAEIPVMFAAIDGRAASIIATIFRSEKDHGIVARKDRGIAKPASLKGKRIGVTLGTSAHFALDSLLVQQKLSINDTELRDLKPEELITALSRGDIDAAATWLPHLETLQTRLGDNGITFYAEGIYEITFNIAGTRDYIAGHPQTIKKFLRALVRAEQFCKEESEAARKLVAENSQMTTARLLALWPDYRFTVALDQSLLLTLEDEARWAIKSRLTKRTQMPNYLEHVYLDGLAAVKPGAVTIIH